ncbi:hypothetical protein K461DRAFT_294049 [Myriangium duriaei CBS 260.36]|uniref:BZIP domain-containing protein n=1 Tax=Myriangium duriaei CBS 260.36 TaxID=1168546 RepID=A0A9P4J1H5_9PEZI|nr:hypothetical protein K461DRAFT_294049 [Myriangium duriaei CBS 260.36]
MSHSTAPGPRYSFNYRQTMRPLLPRKPGVTVMDPALVSTAQPNTRSVSRKKLSKNEIAAKRAAKRLKQEEEDRERDLFRVQRQLANAERQRIAPRLSTDMDSWSLKEADAYNAPVSVLQFLPQLSPPSTPLPSQPSTWLPDYSIFMAPAAIPQHVTYEPAPARHVPTMIYAPHLTFDFSPEQISALWAHQYSHWGTANPPVPLYSQATTLVDNSVTVNAPQACVKREPTTHGKLAASFKYPKFTPINDPGFVSHDPF